MCADTFMSFFGGTAVFAILGSMAERMKVDIKDVVSSRTFHFVMISIEEQEQKYVHTFVNIAM